MRKRWRRDRFPSILITGGASPLAQVRVSQLSDTNILILFDDAPIAEAENVSVLRGSLLNDDDVWRALRNVDAVVHIALPPVALLTNANDREHHLLDLAGRGTYTLFDAAIDAGVKRFVIVSTLELFTSSPDDAYITEEWQPLPALDLTNVAPYLSENVAREFVRDYPITATCLRVGSLSSAEDPADTSSLLAVDTRDAAQAVVKALDRKASDSASWTRRWSLYHITANYPNPRYLINKAKQQLGYEPVHKLDAV